MPRLNGSLRLRSRVSIAMGLLAAAGFSTTAANAVSLHVKLACANDYYAYCSQFASGSPETRACMRAVGEKLSTRCINALVDAGEVSRIEVSRRSAQLRQ